MESNATDFHSVLTAKFQELTEIFSVDAERKSEEIELLKRKLLDLEGQLLAKDEAILCEKEKGASMVELYKNRFDNSVREADGVRTELANYIKTLIEVKKGRAAFENQAMEYKTYYLSTKGRFDQQKRESDQELKNAKEEYESKIEKLNTYINCLHTTLARYGVYNCPELYEQHEYSEAAKKYASKLMSTSAVSLGCSSSSSSSSSEKTDERTFVIEEDAATLIPEIETKLKEVESLIDPCKEAPTVENCPEPAANTPKVGQRNDFKKVLDACLPRRSFFGKHKKVEEVVECKESKVDAGQPETTELNQARSASEQIRIDYPNGMRRQNMWLSLRISKFLSTLH